jgi:multicomponent K+:H+ antiporter subunit G
MGWFGEVLVSALILIGAFFLFVGSFGLAKLPDMMRRLHAPTKSTTLGIGSMLIASMVYFFVFFGDPSVHEFLITLFLFLTAPVSAHMIAKAHILRHQRTRDELSPTGRPAGWSTLDSAIPRKNPRTRHTAAKDQS